MVRKRDAAGRKRQGRKPILVGQKVQVPMGTSNLVGEVAEDRGPIGVEGRRLYRIVIQLDDELVNLELPADEFTRVRTAGETRRA